MSFVLQTGSSRPRRRDRRAPRARSWSCIEHLEDRCVLSAGHTGLTHHLVAAAHGHAAAIAPAQSNAFTVEWTFPANGQGLGGGPGFIAVAFTQLPDYTTVNAQDVQLAHRNADGSYTNLSTAIWVNPSNDTIVLAPTSVQPNGLYVVAIYSGVHSVTGAAVSGPIFETFSINDSWGSGNPITVFPSDNGQTGVIVADQSRALNPATVNSSTIQVFALNPDGSHGAQIPVTIVYDPNIPSIELALQEGLQAGTYQFVEHGVQDASGNTLTSTITENFTIPTNQVAPGPNILPNTTIAVSATFPSNGAVESATPIASVTFNQEPDASTINNGTIQLVRWLPAQNTWSSPLPISLTDNGLHSVIIIPTAGLQLGNYLIAVNGVKDLDGRTMTAPQYFHYTFTNGTLYPVDARTFSTYPSFGATVNGTPPAILVFLQKFDGEQASSINTNTVQLLPWLGTHTGNPLPIGVAYNPWPGLIVISPFFTMTPGTYVIQVNGVTDLAGNVQNGPFSSYFNVT